jgi:hypothetical protein
LHLVSLLPNGVASGDDTTAGTGNAESIPNMREQSVSHAVSADGSRVFWTASPQGPPGIRGGALIPGKVFVRINATQPQSAVVGGVCTEADRACTLPISESVSGEPAHFEAASTDGTRAIFKFENSSLKGDLYEFNVAKTKATLIAHKVLRSILGASEDASRLYFASEEVLTGVNAQGSAPVAGKANLYYFDSTKTGSNRFRFIGSFSLQELNSVEEVGPFVPRPVLHTSRVSADGLAAIFTSFASLTGYDNVDIESGETVREVFLYDAAADSGEGALHCISCDPSGERPEGEEERQTGNSGELPTAAVIPGAQFQLYFSRALSADGKRAYFNAYGSLVPGDTNGAMDVYQWEAPGSGGCTAESPRFAVSAGGCLSLISSGESPAGSEFLDATPTGSDVFFRTAASLLPQDYGLLDVYDARIDGGFPPPPLVPGECEGEACQHPGSPPGIQTPASAAFSGPGNLKPAKKKAAKKKGKKKKKVQKHKRNQKKRSHGRTVR